MQSGNLMFGSEQQFPIDGAIRKAVLWVFAGAVTPTAVRNLRTSVIIDSGAIFEHTVTYKPHDFWL
ncbi:MAG TPA: hypothetical protein VH596_03945 [Terriglobales bacterium]|jgi:hypothetical protein